MLIANIRYIGLCNIRQLVVVFVVLSLLIIISGYIYRGGRGTGRVNSTESMRQYRVLALSLFGGSVMHLQLSMMGRLIYSYLLWTTINLVVVFTSGSSMEPSRGSTNS